MRHLLFVLFSCLGLAISPTTLAQDTLVVGDDFNESVIEGVITQILFDTATIQMSDGTEIKVDIDDLEIEDHKFDDYFEEGTAVRVVGQFDGDEFNADQIIKINPDFPLHTVPQ